MRRSFAALFFAFLGLMCAVLPASAAGKPPHVAPTNWTQHDTAVYVVSTLNLVHLRGGRWLPTVLTGQYNISRFDVFADVGSAELYFVALRRDDGTVMGALAYRMGWLKPKSVSPLTDRIGVRKAPRSIADAYRSHPKQLIGSFASTMPS